MQVKFWGTRGLVSAPRLSHKQYGGNTCCIEIKHNQQSIIIDAGFGISLLGDLFPLDEEHEFHILFTHFHWDHIQGLPFFKPIYTKKNNIQLYSPFHEAFLEENLDKIFDESYSPFRGLQSMPANIVTHTFRHAREINGFSVEAFPLNHGHDSHSVCFGYKIYHTSGHSVVIATDHEARPSPFNDQLIELAQGCDVLIHDAQLSDQEYLSEVGCGHSSYSMALENARQAKAQFCLLTHHAPHRTDSMIEYAYGELKKKYPDVAFVFAQECQRYEVIDGLKNLDAVG